MTNDEHAVRERAYHLWEAAGRPDHREHEFWQQATREHAAQASNGKHSAQAPGAPAATGGEVKAGGQAKTGGKTKATASQTPPAPPSGREATMTERAGGKEVKAKVRTKSAKT